MNVRSAAAKSFAMENAATASPHGTDSDEENLPTGHIVLVADLILPTTASGHVVGVTAGAITPDPSGPLSSAEELQLATIRKNWARGWIPTFSECQFLLEE